MRCEPTQVRPISESDISRLKEKYRQEQEKRMRPEGQGQYREPEGAFADAYESDPYTPVVPRAAIVEELDVAILGGGWGGLLAAYHLKEAGISTFRNIDHAGDFGGCWYWNRYPGVQCDNDAYCYLPLLEEMGFMPSKKYEDGAAILNYMQSIARRFELYKNALFHTRVTAIRWDESMQRWRLSTNNGDDIRARFVVMALGPLNKPKLPGTPGMDDFKGEIFHTARWNYEYTGGSPDNLNLDKLKDKTVAILGTGATAVQAIPYLGRFAKQLYVIQRTPSCVDERNNLPTDPDWVNSLKPGWQKERMANANRGTVERFKANEPDIVCDIWTEVSRNINAILAQRHWPEISQKEYGLMRRDMDFQVMERLRSRVDDLVDDKDVAEILKPYYRFLCKRPCSNDDFYSTFNRPNVSLIDVSATQGLEQMTENGFVHNGEEYPIDCFILASGFEMTSNLKKRWGIDVVEGRDGVSIYDYWDDGYQTLHGMTSHGFPNQFYIGFIQGGLNASTTETFSKHGQHIAYLIKEAMARDITLEPTKAAQDAWVKKIRDTGLDMEAFARQCTPGYYNNEGEKKFRWYLGETYGPGWEVFQELIEHWRKQGDLEGFDCN
jgi:cation diffusion facilitator CzcD-associated flavoprotein CzcO